MEQIDDIRDWVDFTFENEADSSVSIYEVECARKLKIVLTALDGYKEQLEGYKSLTTEKLDYHQANQELIRERDELKERIKNGILSNFRDPEYLLRDVSLLKEIAFYVKGLVDTDAGSVVYECRPEDKHYMALCNIADALQVLHRDWRREMEEKS